MGNSPNFPSISHRAPKNIWSYRKLKLWQKIELSVFYGDLGNQLLIWCQRSSVQGRSHPTFSRSDEPCRSNLAPAIDRFCLLHFFYNCYCLLYLTLNFEVVPSRAKIFDGAGNRTRGRDKCQRRRRPLACAANQYCFNT
ncbi:hypothetical protein Y032_0541g3188 [Ancylostoma ceylanicum]|uniref:Uncharacterized protein n=1 Tax=Ancylostoma ceylanicum TaxID=53326 RepID=A0A016WSA0_9BILA|nr:hypothetical protein Y032_0541g3188 [Ancylostoma ceylanicum]